MIRVGNRLLAFVLGALLIGAGLLVIIEGVWTWTNSGFVWIPGEQWLRSFETTPWSDTLVIAASAAVAVLGLGLLLLEVRSPRARVLPYHTDTPIEWLLLRRSTERHLSRRLARVPTSGVLRT